MKVEGTPKRTIKHRWRKGTGTHYQWRYFLMCTQTLKQARAHKHRGNDLLWEGQGGSGGALVSPPRRDIAPPCIATLQRGTQSPQGLESSLPDRSLFTRLHATRGTRVLSWLWRVPVTQLVQASHFPLVRQAPGLGNHYSRLFQAFLPHYHFTVFLTRPHNSS